MANTKSPDTTNLQVSREANERVTAISEETGVTKLEVASQLIMFAASHSDAVITTRSVKFTKKSPGKK